MCGTALLVCTATGALAQEVISLDPILVEARDDSGNTADQSTSVYVADAEVEAASMGDLKDLFAGIASVSVGGAIPLTQKMYVNGVDALNLAITVDGVSQNNRVFHHASANAFDPGMMKFVRVDPGVATADAGFEALAGAVTMETIDASDLLKDGETFGGKVRLSYSDNSDTFATSVALAKKVDGFELLGYAKYASGNEYTDGDGNVEQGTETDLTIGLLKAAYESDAGHRFELSAQQMQDEGLRNDKANFGTYYRSEYGYFYEATRNVVSLSYENTHATGLWDPEVFFGYSSTEIYKPESYDSNGLTDTFSAKVQNTFDLGNGMNIVAGVDYIDKTSQYETASTGELQGYEQFDNVGIFMQARSELASGLSVSTGLRFDSQNFTDVNGDTYDNSGFSSNLSVDYALLDNLSVHAGYSTVFGGIPIEDNYLFSDAWDYSGLTEVTRGENIVLGADFETGNVKLGAEVFQTRLDNVRTSAWDSSVSAYTAAHGDFESRGYNLSATYDWFSGFARLTFNDSETLWNGVAATNYALLDSGAMLGKVLALELQQELPNQNLLIGGMLEAADDVAVGGDAYADSYSIAGYAVLDVFAEYHVPTVEDLVLRLTIDNVFDKSYADRATYGGEYEVDDGFQTIDEPGRTISLIATIDF
jgi:hemoglobin/transferrin/lactoferrin receptor protein